MTGILLIVGVAFVVALVVWLSARRRGAAEDESRAEPVPSPEADEEADEQAVAQVDEWESSCTISSDDVLRALREAYRQGARLEFEDSGEHAATTADGDPSDDEEPERASNPAVAVESLEEPSEESISMTG